MSPRTLVEPLRSSGRLVNGLALARGTVPVHRFLRSKPEGLIPSAKKVIDRKDNVGKHLGRNRLTPLEAAYVLVAVRGRVPVYLETTHTQVQ
jgi:hypothetical protein